MINDVNVDGRLMTCTNDSEYVLAHWMIDNMNQSNNIIVASKQDIIKGSGKSNHIVNETIRILKTLGLIKTKDGLIIMSPQLSFHGTNLGDKRRYTMLVHMFNNF